MAGAINRTLRRLNRFRQNEDVDLTVDDVSRSALGSWARISMQQQLSSSFRRALQPAQLRLQMFAPPKLAAGLWVDGSHVLGEKS
jgi:hypothetical protein